MTLWDKIKGWFSSAATTIEVAFTKDEQAVLTLVKPLLGAAEASALQDLITFIKGVLSQASSASDLPTWEGAVLNALEGTGSELFSLAKGLGSNLLQAVIAFVLAQLPADHPAVAGPQ